MFETIALWEIVIFRKYFKPQKYKKISYTLYIYNVILKYTSIYYTVNYTVVSFHYTTPPPNKTTKVQCKFIRHTIYLRHRNNHYSHTTKEFHGPQTSFLTEPSNSPQQTMVRTFSSSSLRNCLYLFHPHPYSLFVPTTPRSTPDPPSQAPTHPTTQRCAAPRTPPSKQPHLRRQNPQREVWPSPNTRHQSPTVRCSSSPRCTNRPLRSGRRNANHQPPRSLSLSLAKLSPASALPRSPSRHVRVGHGCNLILGFAFGRCFCLSVAVLPLATGSAGRVLQRTLRVLQEANGSRMGD